MYYQILRNLGGRWPKGDWKVIIDKDEKVDFATLRDCINVGTTRVPREAMQEIIWSLSQLEELEMVKRQRRALVN